MSVAFEGGDVLIPSGPPHSLGCGKSRARLVRGRLGSNRHEDAYDSLVKVAAGPQWSYEVLQILRILNVVGS